MDRLTCYLSDPALTPHPLGVVRYTTATAPPVIRAGIPAVDVHLAGDTGQEFTESWTSGRPVTAGVRDGVTFGHDGEYVFCAAHVGPADRYAPGVRDAYLRAFRVLADLGYPYVVRMWNFVGHLNRPNADGLEIYRDFCLGRAEAFDRSPLPPDALPAATGVGAHTAGVTVTLLGRREPGHVAVENSRQIPAYEYPGSYGPRAPAFARATRLPGGPLLVSGTAGIVGHRTVHAGDVAAQTRTTLANLTTLTGDVRTLDAVKIYVRHRRDLDVVRRVCGDAFAGRAAYLTTDLCRADLLVEIEGVASAGDPGTAG